MPLNKKLGELRAILRLHANWFRASLLGKDVLTDEELAEIEAHEKLSLEELDFVQKSFLLGKLKSVLTSKEYKALNYQQLLEEPGAVKGLDKIIVDYLTTKAELQLKRITDDIEANAFDILAEEYSGAIDEALVSEKVLEEVKQAVLEKKTYQQLASSLASKLQTSWTRDWERVAKTELHSAKVRGVAQAIITKHDIYSNSDGLDSDVSVVPDPKHCEDCAKLYLDSDGNPKVFKLKELLSSGPNTDHKKKNGIHYNWKPTLPPLHPHCGCGLQYIPPGYGWKNRRLVVVDRSLIRKAVSPSATATIKPPGPPQGDAGPSNPVGSSLEGSFGRPKGTGSTGMKIEYDYFSGSGTPPADGGWEQTESGAWRRPKGAGSGPGGGMDPLLQDQAAREWGKAGHPHAKVLDHLSNGKIATEQALGQHESGINESYRVAIAGNGRGLMKPAHNLEESAFDGNSAAPGLASVPFDNTVNREVACYSLSQGLGLDLVPPTTSRSHKGKSMSAQAWQEDMLAGADSVVAEHGDKYAKNTVKALIDNNPEMREKFEAAATFQLLTNNNDGHDGNYLVSKDLDDVKLIDGGLSFGNGMFGARSWIHEDMHRASMKTKIPEKLQTRLKNMSPQDFSRMLGEGMEPWAKTQTYMRAQYLLHLQETEGHLDFDKFRPVAGRFGVASDETGGIVADGSSWGQKTISPITGKKVNAAGWMAFQERQNKGELQHQLFETFAVKWLDDRMDPSHPEHSIAQQIDPSHLFMGTEFTADKNYIGSEKHAQHIEKTVKRARESEHYEKLPEKLSSSNLIHGTGRVDPEPPKLAAPLGATIPPPNRRKKKKESLEFDFPKDLLDE